MSTYINFTRALSRLSKDPMKGLLDVIYEIMLVSHEDEEVAAEFLEILVDELESLDLLPDLVQMVRKSKGKPRLRQPALDRTLDKLAARFSRRSPMRLTAKERQQVIRLSKKLRQ